MKRLVLVDDEEIIRQGLVRMIDWKRLDITLTASCSNALTALDSMTDSMPDILLTDVRMPGMDGLELVEKGMALNPQLKAIILSGYDTFEYARKAMQFGVREYLLKPCSAQELESALSRVCGEIDKERRHVLHLSGERQDRIAAIQEKLESMSAPGSDQAQMQKQLQILEKSTEDPSLLKEALVRLITVNMEAGQAEWGIDVISKAMSGQEPFEALALRTLTHLQSMTDRRGGFVGRMVAYADAHYADEPLSLQFLADQVIYMSADYISREFCRETGKRFSAYLMEVRMEHAKRLMSGKIPLHSYEIAEQVGLGGNPHYFSQVFRKYTGMTPTEYRAALTSDSNVQNDGK